MFYGKFKRNSKAMKSYTKSQLAFFAGVSPATFRRWLQSDAAYLRQNGITPQTKLLPPAIVAHLARKYAIDLPDSYSDSYHIIAT